MQYTPDERRHTRNNARRNGLPRPVSEPSSESPSEKPMLMAAPTAAASPTRKAIPESPVANAGAKSGVSVETDPSMRPRVVV